MFSLVFLPGNDQRMQLGNVGRVESCTVCTVLKGCWREHNNKAVNKWTKTYLTGLKPTWSHLCGLQVEAEPQSEPLDQVRGHRVAPVTSCC